MVFTRLLVPLDGSRLAEAVLPAAVYFAERFRATLILLHIVEAAAPAEVHGDRHLTDEAEACSYLDGLAARLARPDLRIESEVHPAREADVALSITEHTSELKANLVMLCSHGRGGLRDVVVGGIAQQVIQRGSTPVFLVPAQAAAATAFACRRILVPLDGDPVHEPALAVATDVARACAAALHLLTVVPTSGTLSPERAATGVLLPSTTTAILDLVQRGAVDSLRERTRRLSAQGIKASAEVLRGDPAASIVEEAARMQADLIVQATHGRTALGAFWSGGVTPKILSQTATPVLLVRVSGAESPR